MADKLRVVKCPSCGAPIQPPSRYKRQFQCGFCGTTLEDHTTPQERAAGQQPRIIVHSEAMTLAESTARTSSIGCVVIGIVILSVIAVAAGLILSQEQVQESIGQLNQTRVYSFGLARMLPSTDDTPPDAVGVTNNSDDTKRMVYVDFDADPILRWQSEPLGDAATYVYNHVVASGSFVYMAYETDLVALNRADGTIVWQATLSDEVTHICRDCLQVFGDWLVALTADGVLTGFNAQSGESTWSLRLNATPRQLLNLAGRPGVPDEENDAVGINVYEPATGALIQRIVPECPNEVFSNRPQRLRIYNPLLPSRSGKNLYVPIAEYRPGCVQNWDAASLTQVWQTTVPKDAIDSLSHNPFLLTPEAFYSSEGHTLHMVGLADGTYQELYSDEDYNLSPLAAQEGTLVVLAERTRGSRQYSLWGIEVATGDKRWQFDPSAQDLYEEGSSVVHDDGLWGADVRAGQVIVFEAFTEPSMIIFTTLSLADGSQVGANEFAFDHDSFSYWFQVLGWYQDRIYLEMDGRLRLIDFNTATEIAAWP